MTAESQDAPCLDLVDVPGLGPACRTGEGAWEVLLDDGTRLPTHGHDPAEGDADGPLTASLGVPPPAVPPTCATSGYAGRVIYARPESRADGYGANLATIRTAVQEANGLLRMDGAELGRSLSLKVRCDADGEIAVASVALAIPDVPQSFANVTQALRNAGYTSITTKHWVFYDGTPACDGCAGTGTIYYDDRLALDNRNNAASGTVAMFSVMWGTSNFVYGTMLHEAAHNMGAVQMSAPRTSGAGHCIDGEDVMCYADGGPNAGSFSDDVCDTREYFDCGHDDYFHTSPPAGSYLATHWNVGSTLNRFLDFSTGCDFTRVDTITLGGVVLASEGLTSRHYTGIPAACGGLRYSLNSEHPTLAEINLCWFDAAGVQLRCDQNVGHATGLVPAGATAARVHLLAGADAIFWFSIG